MADYQEVIYFDIDTQKTYSGQSILSTGSDHEVVYLMEVSSVLDENTFLELIHSMKDDPTSDQDADDDDDEEPDGNFSFLYFSENCYLTFKNF